jgi:hypothetical protein
MSSNVRSARIDLSQNLPVRARALSADATSKIFGGCLPDFTDCSQNSQCCSYFCWRMWWISSENRWEYQCLPYSAKYH